MRVHMNYEHVSTIYYELLVHKFVACTTAATFPVQVHELMNRSSPMGSVFIYFIYVEEKVFHFF